MQLLNPEDRIENDDFNFAEYLTSWRKEKSHREEFLFLHTLADLDARSKSKNEYDLLLASALIRKLLLDSPSLFERANREIKLKPQFEIIDWNTTGFKNEKNRIFSASGIGLSPDLSPPIFPVDKVGRDVFLQKELIFYKGSSFTVKDVIKFEANFMGGVHFDAPIDEKEVKMKECCDAYKMQGFRPTLIEIKGLIRVVLKALNPLKELVEKNVLQ